MNIGKAIKRIRGENSIPQYVLAQKVGITQANMSKIERGLNIPTQRTISKISKILKVSVAYIYLKGLEKRDFGKIKTKASKFDDALFDLQILMIKLK